MELRYKSLKYKNTTRWIIFVYDEIKKAASYTLNYLIM